MCIRDRTNAGATSDMSASELCDLLIAQFTSPEFSFDGLTGEGMTWDETGAVSKSPKGMVIANGAYAVSYTHIDVYKRQLYGRR